MCVPVDGVECRFVPQVAIHQIAVDLYAPGFISDGLGDLSSY